MKATTIAIAVCFALAWTALPAVFPALDEIAPAGDATASRPCVIGPDDCLIPMYCFTEPCPSYP